MQPKVSVNPIVVQQVAATTPGEGKPGLVTLLLTIPLSLWRDFPAAARFCRTNTTTPDTDIQAYTQWGIYIPDPAYRNGHRPQRGYAAYFADKVQDQYPEIASFSLACANILDTCDIAYSQIRDILPPIFHTRGLVTGTYLAWRAAQSLCFTSNPTSQDFGLKLGKVLDHLQWEIRQVHLPFVDTPTWCREDIFVSAARCNNLGVSSASDELWGYEATIGKQLDTFGHCAAWSPFWLSGTLCYDQEDIHGEYGWLDARQSTENAETLPGNGYDVFYP